MTLSAAIQELKVEITEEGFTPELLVEVAEMNEINPILLERKFTEQFGKSPAEYQPPRKVEINPAPAITKSHELFKKCGYVGGTRTTGVVFEHKGRKAVSVAWTAKGHHFIFADTLEDWTTSWNLAEYRNQAMNKFIQENL